MQNKNNKKINTMQINFYAAHRNPNDRAKISKKRKNTKKGGIIKKKKNRFKGEVLKRL